MMKKILVFTLGLLLLSAVSCVEKAEVWDSSTLDFAGEWWADHDESGMVGIMTYNTVADDGKEMWITDSKHFWDYKVKCPINKENLTFGGTNLINAVAGYEELIITIKDGKILKNAAHSKSGVAVDSIYYKISFSDDSAANIFYEVKGLRKTGFVEDNY